MKLYKNEHNELRFSDKFSDDNAIHLIHCNETLEEIKEDSATPYLVAEECTNFPRIHLVTYFSEDEALQQVDEYLREQEDDKDSHLIGVFKLDF